MQPQFRPLQTYDRLVARSILVVVLDGKISHLRRIPLESGERRVCRNLHTTSSAALGRPVETAMSQVSLFCALRSESTHLVFVQVLEELLIESHNHYSVPFRSGVLCVFDVELLEFIISNFGRVKFKLVDFGSIILIL